jgi:aryl-alcohol dehydrogenase-like predicted oxidoreductase
MHTRIIPSSGERLPVIGCGTYVGFDVAPGSKEFARLPAVLDTLLDAGGALLDSSPMYGKAEAAIGQLLHTAKVHPKTFLATKVWTHGKAAGISQMEHSFALMRVEKIDLMQVHNLVDCKVHLETLRDWKARGRIRYIGVSHYSVDAYDELEKVLRSEPLDFVQLNYSAAGRAAEQRLLPLAQERGIAVIVNMPFGGGGLLQSLRNKPLPAFAASLGCSNWSSLLLKFVLSNPAVTCVIPGTGNPVHMQENVEAGKGLLPDQALRDALLASLDS